MAAYLGAAPGELVEASGKRKDVLGAPLLFEVCVHRARRVECPAELRHPAGDWMGVWRWCGAHTHTDTEVSLPFLPAGIDWAGEAVSRVSGISLGEYFEANIFGPLGVRLACA